MTILEQFIKDSPEALACLQEGHNEDEKVFIAENFQYFQTAVCVFSIDGKVGLRAVTQGELHRLRAHCRNMETIKIQHAALITSNQSAAQIFPTQ